MSAVKTPTRQHIRQGRWPAPGSLPPPSEHVALGKTARGIVPREDHAMLDLPAGRLDPVDLLEQQARTRLPELVPVRYGRMLASPFAYFRGAALPMASDLASTPITGLTVQACGDAHLSNFGVFGSPERRLVFDINDFDETLPGPWEWDVKRLAASVEVAARESGIAGKQRRKILLTAVARYRDAMRTFAGMTNVQVWYSRADVEDLRVELQSSLSARMQKAIDQGMARARTRDSTQALAKMTHMVGDKRRIRPDPPLVVPFEDLTSGQSEATYFQGIIGDLLSAYRRTLREDSSALLGRFEPAHLALKVVGVGSVGTRCWILLMLAGDGCEPLFLQVKEAEPSVLSHYNAPSKYANQGQRVVVGQRFTQASSDIFLGWFKNADGMDGRPHDYYVRQLRDWKLSADISSMSSGWMRKYASLCAWTLARAHARTGDRVAIGSYLGSAPVFDNAIADFAASYADQNERDYRALAAAAESGRVHAELGL